MKGLLLTAAALACAVSPALASTNVDGSFTAVDYAFRANGTNATTLTIAPGQTVSFSYPEGNSTHDVEFTSDRKPDCTGLPPFPFPPRAWMAASCRFDQAGTYAFACGLHPEMTGTVVVAVPTPSPTPTATADPITPGATPTPAPTPGATTAPTPTQTSLALKLAGRQKGTRVRGSLRVDTAGSRVEVTVRSGKTKSGSWVKQSVAAGRTSFVVVLNPKTRSALRAKRRLNLRVTVALTPPGAKTLITTAKATVSL